MNSCITDFTDMDKEGRSESVPLENLKLEEQKSSCQKRQSTRTEEEHGSFQDFDDLLDVVGSVGKYQRFLLYGILFPISIFETLLSFNLWYLMDEPDHWCNTPGREELGIGLEKWKNLTIPRNDNGQFSKCTMYNTTNINDTSIEYSAIGCTSGWEYDFSIAEYRSILTDYNWVCDKSHWPYYVHTARNTGRAIGTFLLGLLADKIGRKSVFIITLVLFTIGRAISLYFASNISAFVTFAFVIGWSSPMFAISINTIALELSGKEYRAWIYSFTWMVLVIGLAAVPVIALIVPNWFVLGWVTVSIGTLSYLLLPWIPESPRWLLTQKGKVDEVFKILKNVAEWNGTEDKIQDDELREILNDLYKKHQNDSREGNHGKLLKLFSGKRMGMHTALITFTWVMNGLVFDGLNLNSLNLHGHRWLNVFLVALMEVPGGFFGGLISDRFGRRWMQVLFFFASGVACSVAAYYSLYAGGTTDTGSITIAVIVAANTAKVAITMSFLVVYLQATELFPTPLRMTGSGFASTISSITIILIPFIVFQGKSSQITPWIVNVVLSFAGMISASFIPETLNHNLPETLEEAENFGKDRKFWSYRSSKQNN